VDQGFAHKEGYNLAIHGSGHGTEQEWALRPTFPVSLFNAVICISEYRHSLSHFCNGNSARIWHLPNTSFASVLGKSSLYIPEKKEVSVVGPQPVR
jgi:hypothetical protein